MANGNGVKPAPMSKLQLMKPGAIQKSSLATSQNKPSSGLKKPGPMKAFVPAASSTENGKRGFTLDIQILTKRL